jgi:hypothetical protein
MISRQLLALLPLFWLCPHVAWAQPAPKLVSVFPLGGQRGTTVQIELRGTGLTGANAVWLGAGSRLDAPNVGRLGKPPHTQSRDGVEAHVKAVPDDSRAHVQMVLAANARVGFHTVALVSASGLSGSLSFWVGPHEVIQETSAAHDSATTAQPVKLPVAINGRITAGAELDYYAFDVATGQTLAFEVLAWHGANFDPQLALYETGGSFLDPQRSRRLLFHEEITRGSMPLNRRLTHHFKKTGRHVVNIGNLFAQAGGDFSYLLRIAPVDQRADRENALSWARGRIRELRSRAVAAPAMDVALIPEAEPKDNKPAAPFFKLPAVLEGTISRPGDIDRFRFRVPAGAKLAFEIQAPRAAPPHFNPRLDVLAAKGAVVLSNLQIKDGKIGEAASRVVQIASQVAGKLDQEGEYYLRVRDLTSIQGSPDHVYRVLVRPQIPHVGDSRVQPDGPVNLAPGGRQRLTLSTPFKEGYAGSVAISVEGLPKGVRAFVHASNSIELAAEGSAAAAMPQVARIWGLPVLGGKSGTPFLMAEVPIMVVKK